MTSRPLWSGITTSIRITSGLSDARLEDRVARGAGLADGLDVRPPRRAASRRPGADDRVVVDDQHAHASRPAPRPPRVVPLRLARLDRERAAEQRDPLAHARSRPSRRPAPRPGRSRGRRPRSPPDLPSVRVTSTMLTRWARGVLDDVRERLLDDAVERGLDLGGRRSVDRSGLEVDLDPRLLGEARSSAARAPGRGRSRRAPSGAARPPAGARPAASRRRARARSRDRLARFDAPRAPEPEQDRRQRLARLVVQLAREPPPLELLRRDDPAQRVALDALARGRPPPPRATANVSARRRSSSVKRASGADACRTRR